MNIQTSVKADKAELQRLAREEAYSTPLKDFHPGAPRLFQNDTLWPWFERLRKEEPVHYCTNAPIEPYWSVTKYNDIMHVDTNHGIFSSDAALGGIIDPRRAGRLRLAELHRDGPAAAFGAAQDGVADVHADASGRTRNADPRAHQQGARQSAAQRDLQFRRPGLDRTDHADAGDAVRFPVRGTPQADALVGRLDRAAQERRREFAGAAPRGNGRVRGVLHQSLERARQFRAAQRPDLDDGAQRRHPAHGPRQSDGQHHPVDRRRQRHHPQHHERLGAGAERAPRPVPEAARQSGADRHAWCRK